MAPLDWDFALVDVEDFLEEVDWHHVRTVLIEQNHLLLIVTTEPGSGLVGHVVVVGIVLVHEKGLADASLTVE